MLDIRQNSICTVGNPLAIGCNSRTQIVPVSNDDGPDQVNQVPGSICHSVVKMNESDIVCSRLTDNQHVSTDLLTEAVLLAQRSSTDQPVSLRPGGTIF